MDIITQDIYTLVVQTRVESMNDNLLSVLNIANSCSRHGDGDSLQDAISSANYVDNRKDFEPIDLVPILKQSNHFVQQWLMYSEDKRTSEGWYVDESCKVGQLNKPCVQFNSIEEAIAEYVVRELDFWVASRD